MQCELWGENDVMVFLKVSKESNPKSSITYTGNVWLAFMMIISRFAKYYSYQCTAKIFFFI